MNDITITMTATQWKLLLVLAGGSLALLLGMFAYMIRHARSAYLGDRWIAAAGSYAGAARALEKFNAETDAMIRRGMRHIEPGTLVPMTRDVAEKLQGRPPCDYGGFDDDCEVADEATRHPNFKTPDPKE